MADIVAFPSRPSVDFMMGRIRAALADDRIEFSHPHFQAQLAKRDLTMRHVRECLRDGEPADEPKRDKYGDWRLKLRRVVAGRKVQVVAAVKISGRVVAVTVM